MRGVGIIVAVVLAFWPLGTEANEYVTPKPPKIGALCGRLFDSTTATVPNVSLRVLDQSGNRVADATSDSTGDFIFPALKKGTYRLTSATRRWIVEFGDFRVRREAAECKQPVSVYLSIGCCCNGGLVKKTPSGFTVPKKQKSSRPEPHDSGNES